MLDNSGSYIQEFLSESVYGRLQAFRTEIQQREHDNNDLKPVIHLILK